VFDGRGKKMKIALFSPLNPVPTGISDYTEEMLFDLKDHLDIDLFHDPGIAPLNDEVTGAFNTRPFRSSSFDPGIYDEILYHMGNFYDGHRFVYEAAERFPGIVVLHDYVLQGFYAERYEATGDFEEYMEIERRYYGQTGEDIARNIADRIPPPVWETEKGLDYPLNEEILEFGKAFIVHSDFMKNRIRARTRKPVVTIPHHGHVLKSFDRDTIRKDLGVEKDDILLLSAGYINKNKRYEQILRALSELNLTRLKYVVAGGDRGKLLEGILAEYPAEIIRLDHLPIQGLESLICAADICINLRFPTMGESSGSLIRMMGYGKPTLVTDHGSYSEFPDYCVLKICPDMDERELLKRYLFALYEDGDFRRSVGREAARYIKEECGIKKCAAEYARFIKDQTPFN
jgi:glycosyltransferase involved in cell wall biosynthesis